MNPEGTPRAPPRVPLGVPPRGSLGVHGNGVVPGFPARVPHGVLGARRWNPEQGTPRGTRGWWSGSSRGPPSGFPRVAWQRRGPGVPCSGSSRGSEGTAWGSGFSARVPRGVLVHGVESGFSARLHHGVLGARRGAGVLCSGLSRGSRGAAWDRGAHALAS